jgi:hypothetical protein
MLAAVTHYWHFWLAVPLALSAVALVLGIILGYLKKVVAPQYRSDD